MSSLEALAKELRRLPRGRYVDLSVRVSTETLPLCNGGLWPLPHHGLDREGTRMSAAISDEIPGPPHGGSIFVDEHIQKTDMIANHGPARCQLQVARMPEPKTYWFEPATTWSVVDTCLRPNGNGTGFVVSYFSGCRAATISISLLTRNAGRRMSL